MNSTSFVSLVLGGVCCLTACSSDNKQPVMGSSGSVAVGGTSSSGGGSGGSTITSGGSVATGGSAVTAGSAGVTAQGGSAAGASNGGSGGGGGAAGGGGVEFPPIEECTSAPSLDRLTQWIASGEGSTQPASGSILMKDGEVYVAKVTFKDGGDGWAVVPVYVANKYGATADLSTSKGVSFTYSATAELHVQLRTLSHWSGGAQYATTLPSTNGQKQTLFVSFGAENWASLFDPPALSWADSLKEAMGFVLVGPPGLNEISIYGLRVDGWTPPCQ